MMYIFRFIFYNDRHVWLLFLSYAALYSEQIPSGGPPSFSGRLVKYSYKVAIGAQKPGSQTQIFRILFRVLTIPGKSVISCLSCMHSIREGYFRKGPDQRPSWPRKVL